MVAMRMTRPEKEQIPFEIPVLGIPLGTVPDTHSKTMPTTRIKCQTSVCGGWGGNCISFGIVRLETNKVMNYWMGSFFKKKTCFSSFFFISPVVSKRKQVKILQSTSNANSLWCMDPWLDVLFPSWVVFKCNCCSEKELPSFPTPSLSFSLSLGGCLGRKWKPGGLLAIITWSARVAILCFERPTCQSSTNMGVIPSCIAKRWCQVSLGETDICSDGCVGYFRRAETVRKILWEQGGMGWRGSLKTDRPLWWSLPLQECLVQLRIAGGVWF